LEPEVRLTTKSSKPSKRKLSMSLLKPAYTEPLPLCVAKKNDLLKLCRSGIIKKQYRQFYEELHTGADIRDCLPEPDYIEDVDEHFW